MNHDVVDFTKINNFIAVAAFGAWIGDQVQVHSTSLQITYSDYVKSQIYDNLVTHLFGRDAMLYFEAGKYLQGYLEHKDKAQQVLQFFYEDMTNFLLNNRYDVRIHLVVDVDLGLKEKVFFFGEEKRKLEELLSLDNQEELRKRLNTDPIACVIDDVLNKEDTIKKVNSYTLAGILRQLDSATVLRLED